MHRSICSYTAYNGKTIFTVSNLLGILIITFYSMDSDEQWSNTKVELESGMIEAKNQKMVSVVGQEILHWMKQAEEAKTKLSENQMKKINDRFLAIGEDVKKYPIFQDWLDEAGLEKEC